MHKKKARLILFLFDILAFIVAVIFAQATLEYVSVKLIDSRLDSNDFPLRIKIFSFIAFFVLFAFYNRGHYLRRIPWWSQFKYIIISVTIALLANVLIYFVVKYSASRIWVIFSWVYSLMLLVLFRQLSMYLCNKLGIWKIDTILIGDSTNIIETLFALNSEYYAGYDVKWIIVHKGYASFSLLDLPIKFKNAQIIDGSQRYSQIIRKNKNNFFIFAPNKFDSFDMERDINMISRRKANYAIVPPIEGVKLYGSNPQYFFGHDIMFIVKRDVINSPFGLVTKRLLDVFTASIFLILLFPVMIIVAFLVKKDGGSIFFIQERVGKNDTLFKCLKFRSMAVDAKERLEKLLAEDSDVAQKYEKYRKIDNDPRITKIGKIIRASSIDEFPQLINVLKGEMSIVGPRPMIPDEKYYFGDNLKKCISVKPGITGLWQVSGRSDTSYQQRVRFDCWYVDNWSFWHDVVILVKTIFVVFGRSGAK